MKSIYPAIFAILAVFIAVPAIAGYDGTSTAMLPIVQAPTVQAASNLLLPGISAVGSLLTGDGTNPKVAAIGPNLLVGTDANSNIVGVAQQQSYHPLVVATPPQGQTVITMTGDQPCIQVGPGATTVALPQSQTISSEVVVAVPPDLGNNVQIVAVGNGTTIEKSLVADVLTPGMSRRYLFSVADNTFYKN